MLGAPIDGTITINTGNSNSTKEKWEKEQEKVESLQLVEVKNDDS